MFPLNSSIIYIYILYQKLLFLLQEFRKTKDQWYDRVTVVPFSGQEEKKEYNKLMLKRKKTESEDVRFSLIMKF
jgi:hypothetical protein